MSSSSYSESITSLRTLFESELSTNPTLYHPVDIERVRTEDWQIKRFLLDQPDQNEGKAFQALCKALQWKKSFGVHEKTDQYFPKELFVLSGAEAVGRDREGHLISWSVAKNSRPFKELAPIVRQFVAHQMETVDRAAGEHGCISVGDSEGASVFNVDNEMQKFHMELFDYYPGVFKGMYVVNLPFLLNSLMKLFMSWMNPKLVKLVHLIKAEQLVNIIEPEYIPVAMKGERREQVLPENLLPLSKRAEELGLDDKFVAHYYKTHKIDRTSV